MKTATVCTLGTASRILKKIPGDITSMLWGSPGIGKTQIVKDLAVERGAELICVLTGQSEPTDIGGLPFTSTRIPAVEYAPPYWAYYASTHETLKEEERGPLIIFFDDVVTGDDQTQAALFKVIHERHVGSYRFRDNVQIVMAGNRLGDLSGAKPMPLALANRAIHLNVICDSDEWLEWALFKGVYPMIRAYVQANRGHLNTFEDAIKSGAGDYQYQFATPRTWDLFSQTMNHIGDADSKDNFAIAVGFVGEGVATSYSGFCRNATAMTSPEDILTNATGCPVPKKPDAIHATICSYSSFVKEKVAVPKIIAGFTFAERLEPEFSVVLAHDMMKIVKTLPGEMMLAATAIAGQLERFQKRFGKFVN